MSATHVRNFAFWKGQDQYVPGSVIVITGAGSGIGRAVALQYAKRPGVKLAIADISSKGLNEAAEELRACGAAVLAVRVDVTKGRCSILTRQCTTRGALVNPVGARAKPLCTCVMKT
jgi:NAD(P)-dependent dehydrogenase (short-subunit alcohol dehydrogenase family)